MVKMGVVKTFIGVFVIVLYKIHQSDAQRDNEAWSPRLPSDKMDLISIPYSDEQEELYAKGIVRKWDGGLIPYHVDCSLENNMNALIAINEAMRQWERKTCIRFVRRTSEKLYLRFIRDTHCWGDIGVIANSTISVGRGCELENVMAHELGHAIGLIHEHNRKDRDRWVKVDWKNIGRFRDAFEKSNITERLQLDYDYASIMHYPWTSFSGNGGRTIRPRGKRVRGKKPFDKVSAKDAKITSIMYNCPAIERKRSLIKKRLFVQVRKYYRRYDCYDRDTRCKEWALAGGCSTKEAVRIQCKLSCGSAQCFGGCETPICKRHEDLSTERSYDQQLSTLWPNRNFLGTGLRCKDLKFGCRYWKKIGECEKNPIWMNLNCLHSCKNSTCDRKNIRPDDWCSIPLGLSVDIRTKKSYLPDSAFTANKTSLTIGRWNARPSNGRLLMDDDSRRRKIGAWCSDDYYDPGYLQVDLQHVRTISYIATQGRANFFERTSKFKIEYSTDNISYEAYKENDEEKIFNGNCDADTPVLNKFENKVSARYVRYIPIEYNWPCVRMELYGC